MIIISDMANNKKPQQKAVAKKASAKKAPAKKAAAKKAPAKKAAAKSTKKTEESSPSDFIDREKLAELVNKTIDDAQKNIAPIAEEATAILNQNIAHVQEQMKKISIWKKLFKFGSK